MKREDIEKKRDEQAEKIRTIMNAMGNDGNHSMGLFLVGFNACLDIVWPEMEKKDKRIEKLRGKLEKIEEVSGTSTEHFLLARQALEDDKEKE